jgi:hypothetical protein
LDGFRIVHDDKGEDAEYKLNLRIGETEYIAWRRFDEFENIANACFKYSKKIIGQWNSSYSNSYLSSLCNTLASWDKVLANRPWWGKNLTIEYLLIEFNLIETFIKELLFEVPNINFLMEFVS